MSGRRLGRGALPRTLVAVSGLAALIAALAVPGPAAATPTAAVRHAAGAQAVPGSYIVVLKDTGAVGSSVGSRGAAQQTAARAHAADVAAAHGLRPTHTYGAAFAGFAARMDAATAGRLAADPQVAYVEQDQYVHAMGTQTNPPWGLDRIDQRSLPLDQRYTFPNTGSDARVFVVDTGIRVTHHEFGGRATVGIDTVGDGRNGVDCNGHGTHMAGTVGGQVSGVAKAVSLVSVRVLNCQGSGTTAGVIGGIDWVTTNRVPHTIMNISLGGSASTALDNAVRNAINVGIVVVAVAGSSATDACQFSPGRVTQALTVGASTETDTRASFSNFGTCVDLYAPGVNIPSAWNTSDSAMVTISGVSSSAAHVSGAAALYWTRFPMATSSAVTTALVANATAPLPLLYIGFIPV